MTHEELKAIALQRPGVKQAYENPDEEMILYRIMNERRQAKLIQNDVFIPGKKRSRKASDKK